MFIAERIIREAIYGFGVFVVLGANVPFAAAGWELKNESLDKDSKED